MSDGMIPVGGSDLPIERTLVDESKPQRVRLEKIGLSPKTDKNGNVYCQIQTVVTEGDYEGETLGRNYLPLPKPVHDDMTKAERIKAMNLGVDFQRFCRSFGIKSAMPEVIAGDADTAQKWQEWADTFVGNIGVVTIENSEFNGRQRSSIRDFVI